jgi:hypothetical protein
MMGTNERRKLFFDSDGAQFRLSLSTTVSMRFRWKSKQAKGIGKLLDGPSQKQRFTLRMYWIADSLRAGGYNY